MKSFCIKLFPIIIISCLGIAVYSNTFFCSFHFDDFGSIVDNSYIRYLGNWQDICNFLPRRFILYLSIAFNYHFNGLDVWGYHVFNLAVHLGSAVLVWWLTLLTLSTPAMKKERIAQNADLIALAAGLIFVAHPVQTQAVTYIVQRAASMATLFYVASLSLYVQSRLLQDKKTAWGLCYTGSLLTAVAAMFTKETAITLPFMILLYEFYFLRTQKRFSWANFFPFLLTIVIIPMTMLLTETGEKRLHQLSSAPGISSMHYLLTQFRVMVTYVRLVFLPVNQNIDYDYPVFKNIFEWPVMSSFLFLISILYFSKRLFLKYRLVSFSILWFFLTLLPESSFLPIKDVIFEHRLYLPLVGFSMFLASSAYYLFGKNTVGKTVIVLVLVITCYSVLTYQRNKVWRDEYTLWNDAVSKSPHKARPYNNRGEEYYRQGKFSQAVSDYNRALTIDPNFTNAYINRGIYDLRQGDFVQADSDFTRAIEIDPDDPKAYYSRGLSFSKQGSFSQALSDYNKAIEINPYYEKAYYMRGLTYAKQGDLDEAISDYSQAIAANPDYLDAYYNRGLSYGRQKNFIQALADFNKDLEINPGDAQAYNNRAVVYYQLKKYDEAWADVHKAQGLGIIVNPQIISALQTASGRVR